MDCFGCVKDYISNQFQCFYETAKEEGLRFLSVCMYVYIFDMPQRESNTGYIKIKNNYNDNYTQDLPFYPSQPKEEFQFQQYMYICSNIAPKLLNRVFVCDIDYINYNKGINEQTDDQQYLKIKY